MVEDTVVVVVVAFPDLMNLSAASFEPLLSNQVAVVGEEQELQVSCLEPSGLPSPRVYWRDPKGHIISDSGPVRVQDNTLIVAKARIGEDDGNYTCVAENMAGETDISAQVVISSKRYDVVVNPVVMLTLSLCIRCRYTDVYLSLGYL